MAQDDGHPLARAPPAPGGRRPGSGCCRRRITAVRPGKTPTTAVRQAGRSSSAPPGAGLPFLGQVLAGGVDLVEVSVPHVDAGPVSVAQVRANVDDIRIVGSLPSSVKGAVLGRVRGDILLDFKDLNREVGASRVHLSPGPGKNTVLARGDLPVGDRQAQVRGWGQLRRIGDRGLAMSVRDLRVVVPRRGPRSVPMADVALSVPGSTTVTGPGRGLPRRGTGRTG
ncbi:LmeA family phospholipid-binding protein [Streptomyces sp. NPDC001212]